MKRESQPNVMSDDPREPEPRKGLTVEELAAELCPRAGQPDHLSCRTCARVASWLERHDAALREEIDRLESVNFEQAKCACNTSEYGHVAGDLCQYHTQIVEKAVRPQRQAGEQMAEALRYVLERIPSMTWPHVGDVQQKAIDALAAWHSGETQG